MTIALGTIAFFTTKSINTPSLTPTQLANINALASNEDEQDTCDNYNGYRRILEGNEKIYDCCYKEQVGRGKEDCKRW